MRILVLGAGGVGGYFGGRLLGAGRDVTFLVRPGRAALLRQSGLAIRSPLGDLDIPDPPTVVKEEVRRPFDLVLLSCKAYDLADAMASIAPAVGPDTSIVPLLNGVRHVDDLRERFGPGAVLGGLCTISASVDDAGQVLHHNRLHQLTHGALQEEQRARAAAIEGELAGAGFDAKLSDTIELEMWEKWVFLASLAGATCLFRGSVGEIVEAGAEGWVTGMLDESVAIAAGCGFPPRAAAVERARGFLTGRGSPLVASMLRDVERGSRVEADHVLGDLIERGRVIGRESPNLELAYASLRVYAVRQAGQAVSPTMGDPSGPAGDAVDAHDRQAVVRRTT